MTCLMRKRTYFLMFVLLCLSLCLYEISASVESNYTCWGQETCCDVRTFYDEDSSYRMNLDQLLSRIQNADKVPVHSPRGRISQFLVSPEDPTTSTDPAYGAWLCEENQTPEQCQVCIDDLLDEIWEGIETVPSCNRSVGIQAVGQGGRCRVRYDMFQFWNPSDTCQPLCCSTEQADEGFMWNYKKNVLLAWRKTQSKLQEKSDGFDLSYRDYYDPTEEEELEELQSHVEAKYRPVVFIGYDCAPWVTGEECVKCVDSLVLSLDHWYFKEGDRCEEAVGLTANDDHSFYYQNPHNEPGATVVRGGAGDWPAGQWPRGSCKFYFDNKPQYDSLYTS